VEPDDRIRDFVAQSGLFSPADVISYTSLTGGVSSDIWLVRAVGRAVCVKRSLARLRVPSVWEAPVERTRYEIAWYDAVSRAIPGSAPRILASDAAAGIFAMEYFAPESFSLWKGLLMAGTVDVGFAGRVGQTLAQIHAEFAHDSATRDRFDSDAIFHAIRIEPYLVHTSRVHVDLTAPITALADRTLAHKRTLVHGDVSPKNILVGPRGPVLLDAECAWFGDPAFDVAFCLNHLLLKCIAVPSKASDLRAAFSALASTYLSLVDWEPALELEARVSSLLPALMLARVDGKSPVEYLSAGAEQEVVRDFGRRYVAAPPARLAELLTAWEREITNFLGA